MHNVKDLQVWQMAVALATDVYRITGKFPKSEIFSLVNQTNRAAVSIASNIAEGAGRNSNKEFAHFLGISNGSCYELETQIIISKNLDYITDNEYEELSKQTIVIQKMIYKLQKSLVN